MCREICFPRKLLGNCSNITVIGYLASHMTSVQATHSLDCNVSNLNFALLPA